MWTWLVATTIALAPPQSADADLACVLQPDAAWGLGPRDVSAVVCNGKTGFFVPSLEFRGLLKPEESEPFKLLAEELRLARAEIVELRAAIGLGDHSLTERKALSEEYKANWLAAEARLDSVWRQPWFWFGAGALTVGVVVAAVELRRD